MAENYGKVLEDADKFGFDNSLKIACFRNCEPVSIFDTYKVKNAGFSRTTRITKKERSEIFDRTRGVAFVCPISTILGEGIGRDKEFQKLQQGLQGMKLARIFDLSILHFDKAAYRDCILTEDGSVIFKSKSFSVENNQDEIYRDFHNKGLYSDRVHTNGYWKGVDSLNDAHVDAEDLKKVYSQIARYVAEKSVEECGVQLEEREFETAKQIPASIFGGDSEFVGRVLTELESIIGEMIGKVKESDSTQIAKVVGVGERTAKGLKAIFKEKIDNVPEFSYYITDSKSLFPEGTFVSDAMEGERKPKIITSYAEAKNRIKNL